ncbi:uncharacterized protein DDB_G0290685-like [Pecten maximus]|uniref:uncharacterized protein DDB_G0290685-like n=1 Tax=Pecten maximus TaxID=6579 RepID=UPI001458A18C|nr:uncharacterized protein DDB_G0290685-like [Pecten maximus]
MDIGDEAALGNKEEEDDGTSDQQDNIVEGTSDQDDVSSTEGGEILSDVEESVSSTNNQDYENFKGKDEAVNSPTGRLDEKLDQLSETNEDEGSVGGEGEKNEEYDQDVESQENDTEEDHENQEEVLQEGDADDISSQEDFQEEGIVGDDSVYKDRNEEENTEYNEVSSQDDMQGDDLADIQSQEEEEENDKQSEDLGESSRDSNFKTGNKEIGDIDDDIDDEDFSVDDIKELDGDADDTSQEETHVLDKETFEELWKKEADSGGKLAEEDSMSLPGEQYNVQKNDIVPDSTTVDTKNQPEGLEDAEDQATGLEDNTDLITSSQQSDRSGDNDVEKGDEMDNEEIVDTEGDSIGSSLYDENEDREGKGFDEFEESAASPEQSNDNNIVCSDSVDNEDQPMEDEEAMGETNGMDSDLHNEQLEDVSQESTYIEQENDMSDDGEIDDDEDDMKNVDDNGSSDGEINDESDLKNEEMNIDKDEKDEESGSVPMSEDESMHDVGESVEGERESWDKLMDGSVDPKQPSNSAGQFMVEQGNSDNDEDWNTLDLEKEEQGNVGVDTSLSGGVQKEDRVQKDVEPEDIDSPEETEDIDSPESDMGEEEGEVEPDNPASPVSEEGQLDEANRQEDNENIYNDVSDEEESYSDDDDEAAPVNNVVDTRVVNRKEEVQQERPKFTDLREKIREGQLKAQSSLPEDHVELDYDEDGMDDAPKATDDNKDKMDDSRGNDEDEKGEDGEAYSDRDDGEVDDDEDCEEGEIKEPGARKPFVKPICRFYTRGQCTWGNNCRFLHPGINDKGNYRLIERPGFESPTKKSFGKWNQGEVICCSKN